MKKSDKLSKNNVNFISSNSDKNLLNLYKENKKLLNEALNIKKQSKLNDEDFLNLTKKYIPIPISIFKNNSPLESLVKYLKENLNLSLSEISRLLNRDQRTIWITYRNSKKNIKELDENSKISVPVIIFSNRKLSISENMVNHLHINGISFAKISKLLNRSYKTIWTISKRIKEKHL